MEDLPLHLAIETEYPFGDHFPVKYGILTTKNINFVYVLLHCDQISFWAFHWRELEDESQLSQQY